MAVSSEGEQTKSHAKENAPCGKIIRLMGEMEKFHVALHETGLLAGNSIACRYNIPEATSASGLAQVKDAFDVAVAQTTLSNPLLQVGMIGKETKKPAWIHLDSIDLANHVKWREIDESTSIDDAVRDLLPVELDLKTENLDTRPGWRFVVVHHPAPRFIDAILIWNHASIDGMSAKMFHEQILSYLNAPPVSTESRLPLNGRVLSLPSSHSRFPPAQHKMCKYSASPNYVCAEAWKEWGIGATKRLPPVNWAPLVQEPIKTKLLHMFISNQVLQNVLANCRRHKTTLTGLLNGLLAFCLADQLSAADAPALHTETAANLRPLTKPKPKYSWLDPHKTMANILTNVVFNVEADQMAKIRSRCHTFSKGPERMKNLEDLVWELAVEARSSVAREMAQNLKNVRVALMKYVPDWQKEHMQKWKRPRCLSWILSNIGVIDGNPGQDASSGADQWSITRSIFAVSQQPNGSVLDINVVAVKGGELFVGISWHEPAVSDEFTKQLLNNMQEWLNFFGAE